MIENIIIKDSFTIGDLAKLVNKKPFTIRDWERKGIIDKPKVMEQHGEKQWRRYSRDEIADILEDVLDYDWQRNVIKNKNELEYIIKYFRNEINIFDIPFMNGG